MTKRKKGFLTKLLKLSDEKFTLLTKRIEHFISIARGRIDVKSRLMLLLNPEKPETSTILTRGEAQFVNVSMFVAKQFDVFKPLKDFAIGKCLTNLSLEARGQEAAIRFTSALTESKFLQNIGLVKKTGED